MASPMAGAPLGLPPPSVLAQILSEVRNTQISRFNEIALDSLFVYDYITTLDQEVDLIWNQSWSFMKALFFIVRYLPLVATFVNGAVFLDQGSGLSDSLCSHWLKFQSIQALVALAAIQIILCTRIWAIFNRNMKLLVFLAIFGVLQLAASSTIMLLSLTRGPISSEPGPGFFVCSLEAPSYFPAYWIPILAFEFTLVVLTLVRGWRNYREARVSVSNGASGQELLNILVRDSVFYFVIIAAVYAANAAVWKFAPPTLIEASAVYGLQIPPIVASKLLFSLRENSRRKPEFTKSELEMTTFDFGGSTTAHSGAGSRNQWDEWGKKSGATVRHDGFRSSSSLHQARSFTPA